MYAVISNEQHEADMVKLAPKFPGYNHNHNEPFCQIIPCADLCKNQVTEYNISNFQHLLTY